MLTASRLRIRSSSSLLPWAVVAGARAIALSFAGPRPIMVATEGKIDRKGKEDELKR